MSIFNLILRLGSSVLLMAALGAFSSIALAGPVGYLQIEGQIEVAAAGDRQWVQVSDNNFTVFSGDRISTRQGAAVLVLSSGGSLGLAPSSVATVSTNQAARSLDLELMEGTLLYSLPGHVGRFSVTMGDFQMTSDTAGERALAVERADDDDMSGRISRLEDGHVQVSVRSGQMQIRAASGSRYLVAAGNEIGLLASAPSPELVSLDERDNGLFKIESPERVSTNETFRIRWDMPDPPEDGFITIAPIDSEADTFDSMASITQGQEIEFEAPGSPGDYEIRYIDAETGMITNFVYLQVIGDPVIVPWYTTRTAIAGMGFVTGLTTAWIICDCDDDDPDPPSP